MKKITIIVFFFLGILMGQFIVKHSPPDRTPAQVEVVKSKVPAV
jgi:hypothetical protein